MTNPAATPALDAALARVAGYWPRWWPGCDTAPAAADVRARLAAACDAWQLSDPRPMPGGVVSLVCAAASPAGPVVVKVNPRVPGSESIAAEAGALALWAPAGASARLLGRRDDDYTLMLERLQPGTALEDAELGVPQTLATLARLAGALAAAPQPPAGAFIPFAHGGTVAHWRRAARHRPDLLAELDALLAPGPDDRLIHGDLHARNVLHHGDTWKVIDPHAIVADRHAEVHPLLDAAHSALTGAPAADRTLAGAWVAQFSALAGLNPSRTARWARLQASLESLTVRGRPHALTDQESAWALSLQRLADALA